MNESLQHLGPESKGAGSSRGMAIELNRILVPVDFSSASSRGLAFAASLAGRFHSKLHLLYVIEPPSMPEWGYVHLEIREAKLRQTAEERLSQISLEHGINPGLVASAKVRSGAVEFEICQAAADETADLIVLASHGLGGLKHTFIGSACEGVVRHARCPVLTVREGALGTNEKLDFAPKRILVTTDFSEASKRAFPYAVALAHKFEASLLLLYVVPSHLPAEISHLGIVLHEKQMLSEAREQLPRFRSAELDPHMHVETLVLSGTPAREICATAETHGADLIVISTHGYTGLKRFAVGSVTEKVVRHAPCPVLIIREREREFVG